MFFPLSPLSQRLLLAFGLGASMAGAVAETVTGTLTDTQLDPQVVTATMTRQSLRNVPAAVSVITREQIEKSPATTVDQLLQGVPGVYAARMDASSPNRIAQTYSRGLPGNSRTLVMLDGIPMNVLYDGQVDWSQLSTQDVERVEVVRGASSGLYGANAMGGVINILSRAPQDGSHSQAGLELGSFNSKRLTASHEQGNGSTSLRLAASRYESDGYNMWRPDNTVPLANRDKIGTVKTNVSAKLMQELGNGQLLEAGVSYLKDETTGFYRPGSAGYVPQTREQYVPSLRYLRSGDDAESEVTLYGRLGKQWADTLTTPSYAAISERGLYEDRTVGLNARHSVQFTPAQKVTFGGDYLSGNLENHFSYPGTTRLRDTHGDLTRYGLFVQDEITLSSRWRAILSGRYDQWKYGGNQTDTGTGQPNSTYATQDGNRFSPKLATLYQLTDSLNLRASAGKAFNLPDMFNLYANTKRGTATYWANPALTPEKLNAYDLGLDYYFGQRGYLKATVYQNDASDFIYSVQRNATNVDKINVGQVRTRGLEVEAMYRLLDDLRLTASYTLNDSQIRRNERNPALVGKQLTNVPRHQAHARADWSIGSSQLFAVVNYVGNRFGDDANATTYRAYTTLDLGGSHQFTKDVQARLTLLNVTNRKYDGIGYVAPGATVTAGVNVKF
jgi:outer membrane receptor protein involved in Fe transport